MHCKHCFTMHAVIMTQSAADMTTLGLGIVKEGKDYGWEHGINIYSNHGIFTLHGDIACVCVEHHILVKRGFVDEIQ